MENPFLQTEEEIVRMLKTVYDPEIPINIYDLGLIYKIEVPSEGEVLIEMTLTAPNCPAADTARTMPLCKFPEIATYKGSGDICSSSNWKCDPHNHDLLQLGHDGHLAGLPYTYLNDQCPWDWH